MNVPQFSSYFLSFITEYCRISSQCNPQICFLYNSSNFHKSHNVILFLNTIASKANLLQCLPKTCFCFFWSFEKSYHYFKQVNFGINLLNLLRKSRYKKSATEQLYVYKIRLRYILIVCRTPWEFDHELFFLFLIILRISAL